MRVLLCSSTFQNVHHGPAKFANLILDLNENSNSEIRVLTQDINENGGAIYKAQMKYASLFPSMGMLFYTFDFYRNAKRIRKEYPFDVIVFNHGMVALWSALWFRDVNVVGMINDDNSSSLSIFRPLLSKKWLRYYIFKRIEKMASKYCNQIIVNSSYLQSNIIKAYMPWASDRKKVFKLYKSISSKDIPKEVKPKKIDKSKTITVLFVKAHYTRGGLDVLASSLGRLDEYQFKLIVMGPKQNELSNIVQLCSPYHNIELEFRGPQAQKEVYKSLSMEADIFSVPSYQEGLGVANIEALAYGIPVVSTRTGGIPEVLSGGKYGWLAAPGDAGSLSEQMKECIEKQELREEKVINGYKFVQENFVHDKMLYNFLNILNIGLSARMREKNNSKRHINTDNPVIIKNLNPIT